MKAIMRSCKPYWLYLIIKGIKTIEVGKTAPMAIDWNKIVYLYCSKDKKSFNKIPQEDREWFSQFLGKVVCEFYCDAIEILEYLTQISNIVSQKGHTEIIGCINVDPFYNGKIATIQSTSLSNRELIDYGKGKPLYAWHISDLKIYDEPKELSEFHKALEYDNEGFLNCTPKDIDFICQSIQDRCINNWEILQQLYIPLTRPPQSWQYCARLEENENEQYKRM